MLLCPHCNKKQSVLQSHVKKIPLPNGGHHLIAYCNSCGKFIKNLPHAMPRMLYFGKYKGKPIGYVALKDEPYLIWLLEQDIKKQLKQAIQEELEKKHARHAQSRIDLP